MNKRIPPELEYKLFHRFFTKAKQGRFKEIIKSYKIREKWIKGLYHFHDFEPTMCFEVNRKSQSSDALYEMLKAQGAPKTCFVMSTMASIDAQEMDLKEVLTEIEASGHGTIILCIPSELGLYYGESLFDVKLIVSNLS